MKTFQGFGPFDITILIISLSTAILYGLRIRTPSDSLRTTLKATSTASLSLLCALNGKSWLLVAALAFGAVGDAFLAWPGEAAFLRGLGSFLIAHLFYVRLFAGFGDGKELVLAEGWRQLLGVVMLALAPIMGFVLVPRVGPSLRLPIAVYSAVSLCVIFAALTIAHQHTVTGATLFALSDCLLGAEEFLLPADSKHHVWMQYAVWILYYGGQLLIVSGLMDGS
ncbi:yhhN family protein [Hirsutella rhossiliensis]|uniref:YhhN family domain-containing protein n=1 Tax=Hirsutella rhossiliensis TaxID=111463 RepID=A0A9P8SDT0_9HYPO|nr:yhhN family domain-containing protein [Hirsutella rhossiliensis]KAH0959073.1 yhhN family domain-containing protein [Hirsutella rhossiliensis]